MGSLEEHHLTVLKNTLESEYVPNLPPILKPNPSGDQSKNLSRAFGAFALADLCAISAKDAANAVVDDFDDQGVDVIYLHGPTSTLYLIQTKLRADSQFGQEEALTFVEGVRKLIRPDLDDFNQHVQNRRFEIEQAIDDCNTIRLVVAHVGPGISTNARRVLDDFLSDAVETEERLETPILEYNSANIVDALRTAKAYQSVNADLWIQKCSHVNEPRITYFGLIQLADLVDLHRKHGQALFVKNIRMFLGLKSSVNDSIRQTLDKNPDDFLFLNNGITALCESVEPKGASSAKGGRKRLKIRGLSIINGAQTIASATAFAAASSGHDISNAKVLISIIKAPADGEFGKSVTRARNHQNPVSSWNFAALDDEQERLRRDLAHLEIYYQYKDEAVEDRNDDRRIHIEEAAYALAACAADPRYPVRVKKEPSQLLVTTSEIYKDLFRPTLTAFTLANAVLLSRYVYRRMATEATATTGQDRLAYKHGSHALLWILAKRARTAIAAPKLMNPATLETALSTPFDNLRQSLLNGVQARSSEVGPLALFRNQTRAIPLIADVMIDHYGLSGDPAVRHKMAQADPTQPFPEQLFAYLVSTAPQFDNLA